MPIVPAVILSPVPSAQPAATPLAAAPAPPAGGESFQTALTQATVTADAAATAAAPVTVPETALPGALGDPARLAAQAAAGLFVVGPGVVLSSSGSPVAVVGEPAPADAPPPSDAGPVPPEVVSRAAEFRLREQVAPQALPQSAVGRPPTLPVNAVPSPVGEPVDDADGQAAGEPVAVPTAATPTLPNPVTIVPATGLPPGRTPVVVAQAPLVTDAVGPGTPPVPPAETAPAPVAAPVATSALPGVTAGDRPNTAGERLAADVADATRLAATTTSTPPPAADFARELADAQPPTAPPVAGPPRPAEAPAVAPPTAPEVPVPTTADARPLPPVGRPAVLPPGDGATFVIDRPAPVAGAAAPAALAAVPTNGPVVATAVAPPAVLTNTPTVRPTAQPLDLPLDPGRVTVTAPPPAAVPFREVLAEQTAADTADPTPVAFAVPTAAPAPDAAPAPPDAKAAAPVPPSAAVQVADEVVAHARTLERGDATEFRMRLDPPDLGRVHVRLVSDADGVRGQVVVSSDAVRQVIEGQLPELRQRLEAAGVTVGRFDVATDPGAGGGGNNPYQAARGFDAEPAAPGTPAARATARVGPARSGRLDVMA